jgi:hypothetical protein
MDNESILHD